MEQIHAIDRVINIIERQQIKGYRKYGKTVDQAGLDVIQWIQHAQEEVADLLVYLEMVKGELNANRHQYQKSCPGGCECSTKCE